MNTVNNTFGVIFYLKKYKATADGKAPIYARITVNGNRIDISVKRSIDPNNWHEGKGMAKGSREEIVKLNNFLEKYRSGIVESYWKKGRSQQNLSKTNLMAKISPNLP
jgi:hypothetical protein